MFKNLKIEINDQQPLDEVVRELEKRGYVLDSTHGKNFVYANEDGTIDCFITDTQQDWFQLTTLTELKEMELEMEDFDLFVCYRCDYIDTRDKFTSVAMSACPESVVSMCFGCYEGEVLCNSVGLNSVQKSQSIPLLPIMKNKQ